MFLGEGLFGLALLVLWVYCIFDVIATDEALMRNLPKIVWLIIVIIIPDIGSLAWLLLGRPPRAGYMPGDTSVRPQARPGSQRLRSVAPDDDPAFLSRLGDEAQRLRSWEDDLKRREEELKRRDEGGDSPPAPH